MRKSKVISIRFTEEDYNFIYNKAYIDNKNISLYLRDIIKDSVYNNNSKIHMSVEPTIVSKIKRLYDMLEIPADMWDDSMDKTFRKGMGEINELFKDRW